MPIRDRVNFYLLITVASVVLAGAGLGLGFYTFVYAKGASYLSNRPEACANCHVMREVLQDWQTGDHHHAAVCNDCHVPQGALAKWVVKAANGLHHSYAFTFADTPVTIRAGYLSRTIVQSNCLRCHGNLLPSHSAYAAGANQPQPCVTCHTQAGHIH